MHVVLVQCSILQLNKASGGLTSAACKAFGSTINGLYNSKLLFSCLESTDVSMSIISTNHYNDQALLDNFRYKMGTTFSVVKKARYGRR